MNYHQNLIKSMIKNNLKMTKIFSSIILLISMTISSFGQSSPKMRLEDKVRIKEAIIIRNQFGNKIWNEIEKVSFTVLLVSDTLEYLINHSYPSKDFKLSEKDDITGSEIYFRKRKYSDKLLATFPAVNGVNCIVVGTPERTNKNSSEWIVTLLHEHFHQYQFTQKDYYSGVEKLELSNGDQTGAWQLNYAFPYENKNVNEQYNKYTSALVRCIKAENQSTRKKEFKKYLRLRNKFKKGLKPADYRYFSFQIWQEGIARYTEYRFLQELANYDPSASIKKLPDFVSFKELKNNFYETELAKLRNTKLIEKQRVCFYSTGFAEGLLLEKLFPKWQENYLIDKFSIDNNFIANKAQNK